MNHTLLYCLLLNRRTLPVALHDLKYPIYSTMLCPFIQVILELWPALSPKCRLLSETLLSEVCQAPGPPFIFIEDGKVEILHVYYIKMSYETSQQLNGLGNIQFPGTGEAKASEKTSEETSLYFLAQSSAFPLGCVK